MEVITIIENQTNLFHEITKPITELMKNQDNIPDTDSGKKLWFEKFVTLLLYFYLQGIDSLRSLITELKTNDRISTINLIPLGLSTIHDAFQRYSVGFFQLFYVRLLEQLPVYVIEEFHDLGRLVICDGSIFPMAIHNFWAEFRKKSKALKLHLHFELNLMIPSCFLITTGKKDERNVMATMIEKAVTYIADRGYLSFDLFKTILDRQAHFIIRVRKNLIYQVKEQLPIVLNETVKHIFQQVTDELVLFQADKHQLIFRRISFVTKRIQFVLVTNRLDLTTYQIIKLYALRWQIELFFRYFKQTLNGIHIINNYPDGVTIQFYVILIVNLLLMRYKRIQMLSPAYLYKRNHSRSQLCIFGSSEDWVTSLGKQIPNLLKPKKQERNAIKNSLFKFNQINFDFY
jgi:hypothetical protein